MSRSDTEQIAPAEFVEVLTVAVRQAMAAVRWLEGRVHNRPKLEEARPEKAALTDADCVSQEILLVAVGERFPGVQVSVEEDTPQVGRFSQNRSLHTVVIDPIDGTLRYLLGDGPYAVLVGLECEGRVDGALVGLPQSDTLVRAVRGGGAQISLHGGPFRKAALASGGSELLVSYGLARDVRERLRREGLSLITASGGAIGIAPLLEGVCGALRISAAPEGLSRRAWVSALPTQEAGGRVESLEGKFPESYQPDVSGVILGADVAGVRRLRASLG